MPNDRVLVMRDIMDGQIVTADERKIARVADVEAEWREDGSLVLTDLVIGPQALAGRVASRLQPVARWLLRDRFEHRIPIQEVTELGPTVRLRGGVDAYSVGLADEWLVEHVLRFIPGNGR